MFRTYFTVSPSYCTVPHPDTQPFLLSILFLVVYFSFLSLLSSSFFALLHHLNLHSTYLILYRILTLSSRCFIFTICSRHNHHTVLDRVGSVPYGLLLSRFSCFDVVVTLIRAVGYCFSLASLSIPVQRSILVLRFFGTIFRGELHLSILLRLSLRSTFVAYI